MKKQISILTVLVLILIFFTSAYSQFSDNTGCGDEEVVSSGTVPVFTPETGKFFRVLIIYITFPDDNTEGPETNIWDPPSGDPLEPSRPMNPYQPDGRLIDTSEHSSSINFMTRYSEYTYSDYFCEMSQGNFDFIGDEVKVLLPRNASQYRADTTKYDSINKIALLRADSLGISFARYDNWNNSNGSYGSDGNVDFVIYHYRYVPGNDYTWFYQDPGVGGSTNPGVNISLDGKNINKGAWGIGNLYNTTRTQIVIEHEFTHFIQDFSHPDINGSHVILGMLTPGHGNSTYCMTPMERSAPWLNWDTATYVDENNLLSSYTLGDFISTGDELKVKIPNTNPAEYFWISNHQKVSKYDGVSRGSNECWETNKYQQDPYCDEGKGLFIFHESAVNCFNSINGGVHYPFDLINSEGRFKWDSLRGVPDPNLGNFILMGETRGSRDSGVSEFNKINLNPNYWSAQLITDDFCSSASNDYFITGDFHGDGLDGYNIGYEEIFSPYSNPTTRSCQNLSNNGLTIVLQSQDTSGAITLKIYYDDADALFDLPPSKPKNVKVGKSFFGNPGNGTFYPKITWDQNIEPDFYNAGFNGPNQVEPKYEIYRGDSAVCDVQPVYTLIASVESDITEFTDSSVTLIFLDSAYYIEPCYDEYLTYSYRIAAKDNRGNRSLKSERGLVSGFETCGNSEEGDNPVYLQNSDKPIKYSAYNYPNPFNPITNIKFELPNDIYVSIKIYDVLGREIKVLVNEFKTTGRYSVTFEGSNLPSGIYYYKIESGNFTQVRKMILLK